MNLSHNEFPMFYQSTLVRRGCVKVRREDDLIPLKKKAREGINKYLQTIIKQN